MTPKRPVVDAPAEVRAMIYRYQARREHSRLELQQKLAQKGVLASVASAVLDEMAGMGVVDDRRFAESFARARVERGYGPDRLRFDLRSHGLNEDLIVATLAPYAREWQRRLERLAERRSHLDNNADVATQARHARFLRRRGFNAQAVNKIVLKGLMRKDSGDDEEAE